MPANIKSYSYPVPRRRRRQICCGLFWEVYHHFASHPQLPTHVHIYPSETVHVSICPRNIGYIRSWQEPRATWMNRLIEQNGFSNGTTYFVPFCLAKQEKKEHLPLGANSFYVLLGIQLDKSTPPPKIGNNWSGERWTGVIRGRARLVARKSLSSITLIFVIDSRNGHNGTYLLGWPEIRPGLAVSEVRPCLSRSTKRLNIYSNTRACFRY